MMFHNDWAGFDLDLIDDIHGFLFSHLVLLPAQSPPLKKEDYVEYWM